VTPACGEVGIGNLGDTDKRHITIIDSRGCAKDSVRGMRG
jgi:hypothetical protein